MFDRALGDFWLYFAVLDPFGTLIVFTGLTSQLPKAAKRKTALRSVMLATIILLAFLAIGQILLEGIHIRLSAFQIAGAIVLFIFGLQMFFIPEKNAQGSEDVTGKHDIAVFPLAVPSIASPGAILAVMLATENSANPLPMQLASAAALLAVLGLTLLFLLQAQRINRIMGNTGEKVLIRISGLILSALACEILH